MNQRAVESAPVIEEHLGIMVELTKNDMTPGSIAGEILDAHERDEIPRPHP